MGGLEETVFAGGVRCQAAGRSLCAVLWRCVAGWLRLHLISYRNFAEFLMHRAAPVNVQISCRRGHPPDSQLVVLGASLSWSSLSITPHTLDCAGNHLSVLNGALINHLLG